MELTMAVVADDAQFRQSPGGDPTNVQLDIIGVFDQIWNQQPPCYAPQVCVAVGFSADAMDFGQQRVVRVQLFDPEGAVIRAQQGSYTVPTPPLSGSRSSFHPVFRFPNVHFPVFGPYVFRVWLGEDHMVDLPIQASQLGG